MKIAFVLHQFLPSYNSGTEQYVYHLAKRMIRRGEDVRVFCYEPKFERSDPFAEAVTDRFEEIPVTRLSGWMGIYPNIPLAQYYNVFYAKIFGKFLADEGIEVVHFFQNLYASAALVEEAVLQGIPTVVNLMDFWFLCPSIQLLKPDGSLCSGPRDYKACIDCLAPGDSDFRALQPFIHGEHALTLPQGVYESVETDFLAAHDIYHRVAAVAVRPHLIRRILDRVNVLVSPSNFLRTVFADNGYDPDRFTLVRYGIDLAPLEGSRKKEASEFRVGYIGTITPHKGLDILVRAMGRIGDKTLSLRVHGDLKGWPSYSEKVLKLAEGDDRIQFLGRFESRDLAEVLSRIDVLVVPSVWYENTPFVILEALASGTPVIASNLGGLSELVEDGVNGYLFEPGDPEDLEKKLLLLMENRIRPEAGRGVRSLAENVDDFLAIYRGLLSVDGCGSGRGDTGRNEMERSGDERNGPAEDRAILQRQVHHLTSQVFHMIARHADGTRRVSELEERIQAVRSELKERGEALGRSEAEVRDLKTELKAAGEALESLRSELKARSEEERKGWGSRILGKLRRGGKGG